MKSLTHRIDRPRPGQLGRATIERCDRKRILPMRRFLLCLTLMATAVAGAAAARPRDVWLVGIPPWARANVFHDPSPSDYLDMFSPDAPWEKSARQLRVFQTTGALINRESDETLQRVFADLKRRHIALAIGGGLLTGVGASGQFECGRGVEGFSAAGSTRVLAERIKKNGGDLAYIVLDEPLWYGHHVSSANACQWSPEYLARQILGQLKQVREIFPAVKVGDVEPIAAPPPQPTDWNDQVVAWTRTWRQVTGEPFVFVRADVVWKGPWRQELPALKRKLHAEGLTYSLIYDGGGLGRTETDPIWTQEAAQRFHAIEADPQMAPDQAVIQTWVRWPSHMLPETQPGTLTNLLLQYLSLPTPEYGRGDGEH